jgi:hypothetical protein
VLEGYPLHSFPKKQMENPAFYYEYVKQLPPGKLFPHLRAYRQTFLLALESYNVKLIRLSQSHPDSRLVKELESNILEAEKALKFIIEHQRVKEARLAAIKEEFLELEESPKRSHDEMAAADTIMDELDQEYFILTGSSIYD